MSSRVRRANEQGPGVSLQVLKTVQQSFLFVPPLLLGGLIFHRSIHNLSNMAQEDSIMRTSTPGRPTREGPKEEGGYPPHREV